MLYFHSLSQELPLFLYHELINFGLPHDPATCSSQYFCEKSCRDAFDGWKLNNVVNGNPVT